MKRLVPSFLALIALMLAASCSGDSPVEPAAPPDEGPLETAVAQPDEVVLATVAAEEGGKPLIDEDRLSLEDLLGDPLFQQIVGATDHPSLSDPLLAAVDALASGQTGMAADMIAFASAEANALEDDQASAETLLHWSAIVRFFEEAGLI